MSIKDLVALGRSFDSDWPRRIVGASERDIQRLQALIWLKLPSFYVDYLRAMGVDLGGLDFVGDGTHRIQDIIGFYEEWDSDEIHPPGWVLLAYASGVGYEEICVSLADESTKGVWMCAGGDALYRVAPSLESYLEVSIVRTLNLDRRFKWVAEFIVAPAGPRSVGESCVEEVYRALVQCYNGAERFGFAGNRILVMARCALVVVVVYDGSVRCYVYSGQRDNESVEEVAAIMAANGIHAVGARSPDWTLVRQSS